MKKILTTILITGLMALNSYAALIISNAAATTLTTTSMYFNATVASTNGTGTNPTCTVFYGTVDYTTNAASWACSITAGVYGVGNISTQITSLSPAHKYYFTWRAIEGATTAWATPSLSAWTKPVAPTSTPAVVTISLQTDTNAVLKAPTNFFGANVGLMGYALASYGYLTNEAFFLAWLDTNTYVQSNTGDWAGTWQGLTTNAFDPVGSAGAVQTDLDDHTTNTGVHAISAIVNLQDTLDGKVDTNHTGDVSINGSVDMYIGRRGSTNTEYELTELVAYNKMRSEIAQSSALSIYANTNAHPVIAGVTILSREIPAAWCITNTYTTAGTYLVATRLYTNYVNQLRLGRYISDVAAHKDGLGDLQLYLELITTDGATTNVRSTSVPGKLLTTVQSVSPLLNALETNQPVATGFYFGYNLYAIKTGSPGVDLILCGGNGSLTSLSTPGLAAADGVTVEVDPEALPRVEALENQTNRWNTGATDASSATGGVAEIQAWPTNAWATSGATNAGAGSAYSYDHATRTITVNSNDFGGGGGAGTTNASEINVAFTPTNYTPAAGNVEAHLVGIDNAIVTNEVIIAPGSNMTTRLEGGTNFFDVTPYDDTALQITGGSPTNGAVWIATNAVGQGKWSAPVMFRAANIGVVQQLNDTELVFTNLTTEAYDYGNNFNGQSFVCPVNGVYMVGCSIYMYDTGGTAIGTRLYIKKNGVNITPDSWYLQNEAGGGNEQSAYRAVQEYWTNGSVITVSLKGQAGHTNYLNPGDVSFFGHLIRELP